MKLKKQLQNYVICTTRWLSILMVLSIVLLFSQDAKAFPFQDVLDKKVTINVKNETLDHIAAIIKKQTGANVSFSAGTIKANGKITLSVNDKKLMDVLRVDSQLMILTLTWLIIRLCYFRKAYLLLNTSMKIQPRIS